MVRINLKGSCIIPPLFQPPGTVVAPWFLKHVSRLLRSFSHVPELVISSERPYHELGLELWDGFRLFVVEVIGVGFISEKDGRRKTTTVNMKYEMLVRKTLRSQNGVSVDEKLHLLVSYRYQLSDWIPL